MLDAKACCCFRRSVRNKARGKGRLQQYKKRSQARVLKGIKENKEEMGCKWKGGPVASLSCTASDRDICSMLHWFPQDSDTITSGWLNRLGCSG